MNFENILPKYESYLQDESHMKGTAEDIFFPESIENALEGMKETKTEGKRLTVQGAKTGLFGGAVPNGGRVINLSHMNKIGEIKIEPSGEAKLYVECGATLEEIEKLAESQHLFFPPNPTEATATIGGMFSTRAAGPNSCFYGNSSKYISSLDFLTANGELWHINRGEYVSSNSSIKLPNGRIIDFEGLEKLPFELYVDDMDLIDFLSGTEGYFGVALAFEIILLPEPSDIWGVVFFFEESSSAIEFAKALRNIKVTTAEYFDGATLELIKSRSDNTLLSDIPQLPSEAKAAIYVETEGNSEEEATAALMELLDAFDACGGKEENTWAESGKSSIKKFRDLRHAVPSILNEMVEIGSNEGFRWETDFDLSYTSVEGSIDIYEKALSDAQVTGLVYGHILTNKLYLALTPKTEVEKKKARELIEQITKKVVANGGLVVSEHGVGRAKRSIIAEAINDVQKEKLETIRRAFDEDLMMNP